MPLITFLSDFGLQEQYVAVVKASILKQLPQQVFLDISHEVKMGNISQAAYLLKSIISECEDGTIHIVAVGTTQTQEHLLVHYKNQYFLGPNNGIFSICFNEEIDLADFYEIPLETNTNFPTKDLYSKSIVDLIVNGTSELLKKENIIKKIGRKPIIQQNTITGHVIYIERHGNLITNITKEFFQSFVNKNRFIVSFEYEKVRQIHSGYHDVDYGDCVVFFNSNDVLEIAINYGNAAELLGMKYDSVIKITSTP